MKEEKKVGPAKAWPDYRAVWRWHFYAGLFCVPFVIVLSISGAIYLFKPQIEAWNDHAYDHLTLRGEAAPVADQVRAALAAVPGSLPVSYELPPTETAAARVSVRKDSESIRLYIHPETLAVLHQIPERDRFMRQMFRLHGELWLGDRGSHLVELAASWTIVMILTGLFLWWPRQTRWGGGVFYPRLFHGSRVLWRDAHSITGFWISALALFLLVTGLPWSRFWGEYFKSARRWTGTAVAQQDWTTGAERAAKSGRGNAGGEHAEHGGRASSGGRGASGGRGRRGGGSMPKDMAGFDRVVATVRPLGLAPPVLIAPPSSPDSDDWTAKSMAANRPLRVNLVVHGKTGEIQSREDFSDRHWIDRAVGVGIAAHEGQLFGFPNQLLGLLTAIGLVALSVSGIVMWWRRRDAGVLGAPHRAASPRWSWLLVAVVVLVGVYLPLFGASLLLVLILDRWVLRRIPRVNRWLGLTALLLVTCVAGCGPKPTQGGTEGTLRSGANVLSEMQVTVHQVQGGQTTPVGFGVPDGEGNFRLIRSGGAEPLHLEPGEYRCTVESIGAPLMIPAEYGRAETTPWRIDWQGSNQKLDLELPAMKLVK